MVNMELNKEGMEGGGDNKRERKRGREMKGWSMVRENCVVTNSSNSWVHTGDQRLNVLTSIRCR
jgi:hypothetical protein